MAKTLCDWSKKDIERNMQALRTLVESPQYICGKCARSACTKRVLCRPIALAPAKSSHRRKAG